MLSSHEKLEFRSGDSIAAQFESWKIADLLCGLVMTLIILLTPVFWIVYVRNEFRRGVWASLADQTYSFPSSGRFRLPTPSSCDTISEGYQCQSQFSHLWGQYSPYYAVSSDICTKVPASCNIALAQILSRHGARNPTLAKSKLYANTIASIQATAGRFPGDFAFLENYKYTLAADQLTDFGRQEMVNSGKEFFSRYSNLAESSVPFIRASGQERVVESAHNFSHGFHRAKIASGVTNDTDYPYTIVAISEAPGSNNSLEHGLCPAFEASRPGALAQDAFAGTFLPPINARLSASLATNISSRDTIVLMDLCPFTTVANRLGMPTSFCNLFTVREWAQYDYYQTLGKYYGSGPGNAFGSTQGVGFVNELIARLTSRDVIDHTCVNHTLDSNNSTFPLGRKIYADFGHDNGMTTVYAALGLFNSTPTLRKTAMMSIDEMKGYSAARTVPFGARMVIEKMTCSGLAEEMVRVVVNGRILPLETCNSDDLGRCKLSAFVGALDFVQAGGRWDECFKEDDVM